MHQQVLVLEHIVFFGSQCPSDLSSAACFMGTTSHGEKALFNVTKAASPQQNSSFHPGSHTLHLPPYVVLASSACLHHLTKSKPQK